MPIRFKDLGFRTAEMLQKKINEQSRLDLDLCGYSFARYIYVRSIWLNTGQVLFCVFMERDEH